MSKFQVRCNSEVKGTVKELCEFKFVVLVCTWAILPSSSIFIEVTLHTNMTKPKAKVSTKPSASKKGDSDCVPNIKWMKNPDWTWAIIAYLTAHPSFHIKL